MQDNAIGVDYTMTRGVKDLDLPRICGGVLPEDPEEAKAGQLVCGLIHRARWKDEDEGEKIAQELWARHDKTVWACLGLFWHYLNTARPASAVLCEHILRSRFKLMDADQSGFYRQCIPLLKEAQAQLELPSPLEEQLSSPPAFLRDKQTKKPASPGTASTKPAQASTIESIQICNEKDLERMIESENDKENRNRLEGMRRITRKKLLSKVSDAALAGIERLTDEQPNMAEALEIILGELRARRLSDAPAKLPPLLLCGGPGTGKTRLVSEIATLMGLPYREIPLAGSADAVKITGLSRFWSTAGSGVIARTLCDDGRANPIFIFDEIEKAGSSEKGNPHDAMLMLLEEHTAKAFRDEFLQCPIDASHASFLATANSIDNLPPPLLSRFIVVHVPPLTHADRVKVTDSIFGSLRKSEPYGQFFAEKLGDGVAETLARDEALSPRQIRQYLKQAMQRACLSLTETPEINSLTVGIQHLPKPLTATRPKLGFLP